MVELDNSEIEYIRHALINRNKHHVTIMIKESDLIGNQVIEKLKIIRKQTNPFIRIECAAFTLVIRLLSIMKGEQITRVVFLSKQIALKNKS